MYWFLCRVRYCRTYTKLLTDDYVTILSFCLMGGLDLVVNFIAFRLLLRNSRTATTVKTFLLLNVALRFLRGFTELYFVSCLLHYTHKPHCLVTVNYPLSGAFVNQLMSAFYVYSHITIQWFEHAITIHRFFAVSFDGVYYKDVSRGHLLQCALLLILPGIPYFGAIITPPIRVGKHAWTLPSFMFQVNDCAVLQPDFGNIFDVLFTGSYYFFGSLCVIALLVDLITLRNIKMRMASQLGAASQQRADIHFSIQMALTHGMNLCYWVLFFLSSTYKFFTKWALGSQMNFNRLSTIVMSVENLLQGLLIIYFNRAAKVKTVSIEATTTQS